MVVRELWSTKYRTPSAVYFISQPGGKGCSLIILQQGEGSEHGPGRRGPVLGRNLTQLKSQAEFNSSDPGNTFDFKLLAITIKWPLLKSYSDFLFPPLTPSFGVPCTG